MSSSAPRRVNLIPMAGAGQRFVDAGYAVPKPLIPVAGIPMVVRAASALPEADEWMFVCRERDVREAHIDEQLRRHFHPVSILTIDHLTEGQAATCLLAAERLGSDDRLTIGACDNGMTYDASLLEGIWSEGADAVIWTFRNNPAVLQDPTMYGWVSVDVAGNVQSVSCKVPISDDPLHDHAVIGAFAFRQASDFIRVARQAIALNRRVNGEFYMDTVLDQAVIDGLCVRVLEVERYVCWGTPLELEAYLRR